MAILLFCALLSGCAQQEKTQEKELTMWLVGSQAQAQTINELGERFFQEQGVRLRCESISWTEAHSKYLTAVAAEVTPDIGTMGLTWGTEFGSLGAMVDLQQAFAQDLVEIREQAFPTIWKAVQHKQSVYGIPFDLTEHILYYRTDIIPNPPDNWDELVELLIELNAKDKGMIFDWGSLGWIGYAPYLWQSGGDFYNPEATRATLDTPQAEQALTFFANLYTKFNVPKTSIPIEQGMRTGDFPIAISGNWKIIGLTLAAPEIKDKWSIAMLPAGPTGKRTTFIGGRIMGIFSQSKMKDQAWEFIKFLFRPDNQIVLYNATLESQDAYLPPNMNTWDRLPMELEFKRILKDQALDAQGPPSVLGWDASTRFINEAIQKVVLQGEFPQEQLSLATLEMNKILNNR